ncbi:hypothetical protein JTB14_001708 [Gonioctena quinquepunctata]|nr:hypothetical protein JTB14_001708 [Gonioctena quinquepunctata]
MYTTPRYEYLKEWYRKKVNPVPIDILHRAETKWLAEKIESSGKDSNTIDEIHWEDEYYSFLSNSENEEGQTEYFGKYHKVERRLKKKWSWTDKQTLAWRKLQQKSKRASVMPVPDICDNNTIGRIGTRKGYSNKIGVLMREKSKTENQKQKVYPR